MVWEPAFAKINLWLTVLGRRPDGYHDIDSLAVFADMGDRLSARPAHDWGLEINGPQAGRLDRSADNLVLRAAHAFADRFGADPMHFTLEKNLPVAAGLGGGSADAAAALRILARQNRLAGPNGAPDNAPELADLAARLGADIPVCLASRAAHMAGVGATTTPITALAGAVVLINPRVSLSTARVFAGLGLAPGQTRPPAPAPAPSWSREQSGDWWLARALEAGNDLEAPARLMVPEIGDILGWIARTEHCLLARMSGSGPTCFGLYRDLAPAQAAHRRAAKRFPRWWVASSALRA